MGLLLLFIVYTVAKFLASNEIEWRRTESLASIVLFITSFVVGFEGKARVTITILLIVGGSLLLVFVMLATMAQLM